MRRAIRFPKGPCVSSTFLWGGASRSVKNPANCSVFSLFVFMCILYNKTFNLSIPEYTPNTHQKAIPRGNGYASVSGDVVGYDDAWLPGLRVCPVQRDGRRSGRGTS